MPNTDKRRTKKRYDKLKAQGFVRASVWTKPEHVAKLRAYAAKLSGP
ncbi:hypothetical protein KAR91_12890 [Candidatus Pacearchaeota archaeon]|nr:hypothetical protein [Candidatus Pacearchaeota archaeon]